MPELPTDPRERVAFCMAFGEHYNGENFNEALRYARFVVLYCMDMQIGLFAKELDSADPEA